MKKSLMLVGAMMISTFIFAQNDAAPDKRRGGHNETMKTVLSLDEKQVSSINEINKKYHEKGLDAKKDLNTKRQEEINKVLTPEQNKKWASYKKERADKFQKAREDRFKKQLSLNDEQLAKLKSTLTPEQYNKLLSGKGHHGPRGHKGGKHQRK